MSLGRRNVAMSVIARLREAIDPRRSIGARLLFGFFLAFLIPGAVFVLLLSRKLSGLQQQSLDRLAGVRLAQASGGSPTASSGSSRS